MSGCNSFMSFSTDFFIAGLCVILTIQKLKIHVGMYDVLASILNLEMSELLKFSCFTSSVRS